MSRNHLSAELLALINSGHAEDHTCVVITLGDATILRFSTAKLSVGADAFLGNLGPSDGLKMSLTVAIDRTGLKAQNVDKILGQQITSVSNALEGATAVLGIAFRNQDGSGPWYYDEKMPGDLLTGAVDEQWVEFSFVGDIYGAQVVGETVASVFPYQDATPIENLVDPNDLPGGGDDGDIGPRPGRGRLPIVDFFGVT
jgi:hypothetical protein